MNLTGGVDGAAETIKSRRAKKKGKKKRGNSSARGDKSMSSSSFANA